MDIAGKRRPCPPYPRRLDATTHPKKGLGQHFLVDKGVISRIIGVAGRLRGLTVLEIGPGRGILTEGLLNAGAGVIAIEADRDLIGPLGQRFSNAGRFELIHGDALKTSFIDLSKGAGTRLKSISNLPYNISGPLLFKFLKEREAFTSIVLMLQKEVAERVSACPGTKAYGILSVLLQAFFEVKMEFNVSKDMFFPKPKVDSAVVSLVLLDTPRICVKDEDIFIRVVKAAFALRRKQLINSLKTLGLRPFDTALALSQAGIDPKRRGETLAIGEFGALTDAFYHNLRR